MEGQYNFFAFEDDREILISSGNCEFLNLINSQILIHDSDCEFLNNSIDSQILISGGDHETLNSTTQKKGSSNIPNEDSLKRSRNLNLPCENERVTSPCEDADAKENSGNDEADEDPDSEDPDSESDYEFKVRVDFGEGMGFRWIRFG